jgi:hypothetical protein
VRREARFFRSPRLSPHSRAERRPAYDELKKIGTAYQQPA